MCSKKQIAIKESTTFNSSGKFELSWSSVRSFIKRFGPEIRVRGLWPLLKSKGCSNDHVFKAVASKVGHAYRLVHEFMIKMACNNQASRGRSSHKRLSKPSI